MDLSVQYRHPESCTPRSGSGDVRKTRELRGRRLEESCACEVRSGAALRAARWMRCSRSCFAGGTGELEGGLVLSLGREAQCRRWVRGAVWQFVCLPDPRFRTVLPSGRGWNQTKSSLVGSGEKGEQEPRVLSMGSVSFTESHIQMDYMRNLTSCLKTNHSLCSNE